MKMRRYVILLIVALLFIWNGVGASADAVLNLPANLEIIEEEAFYGTSAIGKVVLSSNTKEIRAKAFANSSLTEIDIPNPSIEIADNAFDNHGANLVIKSYSGSTAQTYATAHNIQFALLETTFVLTQTWEDFAGASSSLIQNYQDSVSISSEGSAYANGRLIVKTEGELPDLSQFNPEAIIRDPENHYLVQFSDSDAAENCADYLSAVSGVVYVEPDQDLSGSDMYIDDYEIQSYSWGVSATNADAYAADLRKRGITRQVIVAVVDTGVEFSHPMLSGRLLQGYDFIDNDNTPEDGNNHGTHVSGTVVDCTPGLNIKIMPVRVLNNSGSGSCSGVAQGIRYAARNNANVINMSLGGGHSSYIDEAVDYALQQGVTVVVAAGNEQDNTEYHCPAHISSCITVSAVNQSKQRAYFSNYGNAVDIAAPGMNITSAVRGGGYASYNGTSMATPHVSAAAAMLLCDNPSLLPSAVESMLRNAATDLGASGWDVYFGAGFLNLEPFIKGGPQQYTVSYDANGGTGAPASQTKVEGVSLTLSTTKPSRANSTGSYTVTLNANGGSVSTTSLSATRTTSYSFKSWNTAADGSGTSYNPGASYTTNADVTLYAQWNSSTTTAAVTLPTPTRNTYTFKGWGTSSSATSGVTGNYTPNGNVTLYAVWEAPKTYTVSYDANGGSGAPGSQTKTHGVDLTLSSTKPTRANSSAGSYTVTLNANGGSVNTSSLSAARTTSYSFKNWNTAANGSGTSYASGANYTENAAVTLFAQWSSSTATAAVSLPIPTRDGYEFKGWAASSNATSGISGSYTPSENTTLYAVWQRITYAVSYDANGGSGAPAQQIKSHGTTLTLSSTIPTRADSNPGDYTVTLNANGGSLSVSVLTAARTTSYTFKNWNTAANGSGASYTPGASYTADASATLYAQWNSSTVTETVTLPTPTRDGHTFKGWNTDGSATAGTTGVYRPSGNVTLYAIWEADTYTVAYDGNGGSGVPASQTKTYGVNLPLSSIIPSRANSSAGSYTVTLNANGGSVNTSSLSAARTTSYSFKNWNTAANGSGTSYASGASYTANAAVTLYAQWNSSTTTAAVALPVPNRDGYVFKGWGTSGNASSGFTGSYRPSGDVTLYALWKRAYDVSYSININGSIYPVGQIKEQGTSLTLLSMIPTRADVDAGSCTISLDANGGTVRTSSVSVARTTKYTFLNWNTEPDGSGTSYEPGASYTTDASVILYAQWSSNTESEAIPLPRAYRDDRDFLGWSTTTNTLTAQYPPGESYTFEEDTTLYAIWSRVVVDHGYCGDYEEQPPSYVLDRDGLLTIAAATFTHPNGLTDYCHKMKDWDVWHTSKAPWIRNGKGTVERVIIFDGVSNIGSEAFRGCPMTSISIPSSVNSIGKSAFDYCSSLTDVFYEGSEAQWDQIDIGTGNSLLFNATIHFNCPPVT